MISLICLIIAGICFILSTFGAAKPNVNLESAGLFFIVLYFAFGSFIK